MSLHAAMALREIPVLEDEDEDSLHIRSHQLKCHLKCEDLQKRCIQQNMCDSIDIVNCNMMNLHGVEWAITIDYYVSSR